MIHQHTTVEIIENNNCIIKAFENNPISILSESNNDKKTIILKLLI